mmetsp:Transcript_42165/g.104491  ORF Transcript_42165/g.104491 Transcript_42165/m.104491 type:complete len:296 (-) Transcript_42165:678-1565(-)
MPLHDFVRVLEQRQRLLVLALHGVDQAERREVACRVDVVRSEGVDVDAVGRLVQADRVAEARLVAVDVGQVAHGAGHLRVILAQTLQERIQRLFVVSLRLARVSVVPGVAAELAVLGRNLRQHHRHLVAQLARGVELGAHGHYLVVRLGGDLELLGVACRRRLVRALCADLCAGLLGEGVVVLGELRHLLLERGRVVDALAGAHDLCTQRGLDLCALGVARLVEGVDLVLQVLGDGVLVEPLLVLRLLERDAHRELQQLERGVRARELGRAEADVHEHAHLAAAVEDVGEDAREL